MNNCIKFQPYIGTWKPPTVLAMQVIVGGCTYRLHVQEQKDVQTKHRESDSADARR